MQTVSYKSTYVLGVRIDILDINQIKTILNQSLETDYSIFITTVNPSFILNAQKDTEFLNILNNVSHINTCDGVGVQIAAEYLSKKNKNIFVSFLNGLHAGFSHTFFKKNFSIIPNRITGVYLVREILDLCVIKSLPVLIVHSEVSHLSQKELSDYLKKDYPDIEFDILSTNYLNDIPTNYLQKKYGAALCTFGEVLQEKYLYKNMSCLHSKIFVGIGGTFDVFYKYAKSPNVFIALGLDWLYKLLRNPRRFNKVRRSVLTFSAKVFVAGLTK